MPINTQQDNNPATLKLPGYIWGLILGFSTVLILILLVTWHGISNLKTVQRELTHVVDNHLEKVISISKMEELARLRIITMYKMSLMTDPFDIDEKAMDLHSYAAEFARIRMRLMEMPLDKTERTLLQQQGQKTSIL